MRLLLEGIIFNHIYHLYNVQFYINEFSDYLIAFEQKKNKEISNNIKLFFVFI